MMSEARTGPCETSPLRTVAGHVVMSRQLYEQTKRAEDAFAELQWIAAHYDEATDEQRARLDRFLEAQARMED